MSKMEVTPEMILAIGSLITQVLQMSMTYYGNQGKIPTLEEITANYAVIQAMIEMEKEK